MINRLRLAAAIAVLALGALTMTNPAAAQDKSQERTVSVSASGTVNAPPDLATIMTGVATEGATAREALDSNNRAMRALVDGLKAHGIEAKDIQTSHLAVEPRYTQGRDNKPPTIVGYRVINQVRIIERSVSRLGETLDKSITLGANQMGGIQFEVSTAEMLKDEARRRAMANALRRAQLYAGAAGAQLDRVLAISETMAGGPGPRAIGGARMAMAEAVAVEPGEQALNVTVHVTWALK